jgi:hypothetical protein
VARATFRVILYLVFSSAIFRVIVVVKARMELEMI